MFSFVGSRVMLHRPSKRKEDLLLTACACAKLLYFFHKINTEFIYQKKYPIHAQSQLAIETELQVVYSYFLSDIESVTVVQQTFTKVSVRWAWPVHCIIGSCHAAFTPFRCQMIVIHMQAVSLLLINIQQAKGSYQRNAIGWARNLQSNFLSTFYLLPSIHFCLSFVLLPKPPGYRGEIQRMRMQAVDIRPTSLMKCSLGSRLVKT